MNDVEILDELSEVLSVAHGDLRLDTDEHERLSAWVAKQKRRAIGNSNELAREQAEAWIGKAQTDWGYDQVKGHAYMEGFKEGFGARDPKPYELFAAQEQQKGWDGAVEAIKNLIDNVGDKKYSHVELSRLLVLVDDLHLWRTP